MASLPSGEVTVNPISVMIHEAENNRYTLPAFVLKFQDGKPFSMLKIYFEKINIDVSVWNVILFRYSPHKAPWIVECVNFSRNSLMRCSYKFIRVKNVGTLTYNYRDTFIVQPLLPTASSDNVDFCSLEFDYGYPSGGGRYGKGGI